MQQRAKSKIRQSKSVPLIQVKSLSYIDSFISYDMWIFERIIVNFLSFLQAFWLSDMSENMRLM